MAGATARSPRLCLGCDRVPAAPDGFGYCTGCVTPLVAGGESAEARRCRLRRKVDQRRRARQRVARSGLSLVPAPSAPRGEQIALAFADAELPLPPPPPPALTKEPLEARALALVALGPIEGDAFLAALGEPPARALAALDDIVERRLVYDLATDQHVGWMVYALGEGSDAVERLYRDICSRAGVRGWRTPCC